MSDWSDALDSLFAAACAEDVWDRPPALHLVTAVGTAVQLPLPDRFWSSAPTHLCLELVARGVASRPPMQIQIAAVALVYESWLLETASEEERDWCRTHSIADHPRGVEARVLTAVDPRDKTIYGAQLKRGYQREPIAGMTGRIVDGLLAIAASLEGEDRHESGGGGD